jgi:tetrapyrrole methylase family protein/MazG family protein
MDTRIHHPLHDDAADLFRRLLDIMARLRAPGGCPWDREQTHHSIKSNVIEEAYEVAAAIDQNDDDELAAELGDLLLQVVFHARIAEDDQRFAIDDVIRVLSEKLVRRHPHVFGTHRAETPEEVLRHWEAVKAMEREQSGQAAQTESMLASVLPTLPAMMEAYQMTTKVARVGFDWPSADEAFVKLDEETRELREVMAESPRRTPRIESEIGDLLFALVNVARLLGIDPESALKSTNRKFRRRFGEIERRLGEHGRRPADSSLAEMDALWNEIKLEERDQAV